MPGPVTSVRPVRPEPARWRTAIGRRLREAREDAGLRLVDVARAAGVSPQYLSEVERGRKEASSEVLQAVTGALGMTLVDLAGGVARDLARLAASDRPATVRHLTSVPGPSVGGPAVARPAVAGPAVVRGSARHAAGGRDVTLLAA